MRFARVLPFAGFAVFAAGLAACAGLVGANFDDECAAGSAGCTGSVSSGGDGGVVVPMDSSVVVQPPGKDSGTKIVDSGPVIVFDGGACPTGLVDCSGFCVSLSEDPAHCGKCATSCPNDSHDAGVGVCVSSRCAFLCDDGYVQCAAGCCSLAAVDASTGSDAGTKDGGSTVVDAGSTDPGIACGATFCSVAGPSFDVCCGGGGDTCVSSSSSGSCGFVISCDDSAQCAGMACCYDPDQTQSLCQENCTSSQTQFCNPLASGSQCPAGMTCSGTMSPSGQTTYSTCK